MEISERQANNVLCAYLNLMQMSGWNKPVKQSTAMLQALKVVFGDSITVIEEKNE